MAQPLMTINIVIGIITIITIIRPSYHDSAVAGDVGLEAEHPLHSHQRAVAAPSDDTDSRLSEGAMTAHSHWLPQRYHRQQQQQQRHCGIVCLACTVNQSVQFSSLAQDK